MTTMNGIENGHRSGTMENYIENHVYKDGELLKKILDITIREKLMMQADESITKVVDFKHPSELQVRKCFTSRHNCKVFLSRTSI